MFREMLPLSYRPLPVLMTASFDAIALGGGFSGSFHPCPIVGCFVVVGGGVFSLVDIMSGGSPFRGGAVPSALFVRVFLPHTR